MIHAPTCTCTMCDRLAQATRVIPLSEVRVGDTVRVEWREGDVTAARTAVVAGIEGCGDLRSSSLRLIGPWSMSGHPGVVVHLLDRPAPSLPTEPGSVNAPTPEQITTLAELEALPPYSIVLDCDEVALRRAPWGGWTTWYSTTATSSEDVVRDGAPLVVLYRPDAEGARRGSARALSARAEVAAGIAQAIDEVLPASEVSITRPDAYVGGMRDGLRRAARIAREYGQGGASS